MSILRDGLGNIVQAVIVGVALAIIYYFVMVRESDLHMFLTKDKHDQEKRHLETNFERNLGNEAFDWVMKNPTKESYRQFFLDYPDHPFSSVARFKADSILAKENEDSVWLSIQRDPSESLLTRFVTDYGDSERSDLARSLLQELRTKALLINFSLEDLLQYFEDYPNDDRANVCERIDDMLWRRVLAQKTEYYTSQYASEFSDYCVGKRKKESVKMLMDIEEYVIDDSKLNGKNYVGIHRQHESITNLIIQFQNDGTELKGSINLGDLRFTDLTVEIEGHVIILRDDNVRPEVTYLRGIFYEEMDYLESEFHSSKQYWNARRY